MATETLHFQIRLFNYDPKSGGCEAWAHYRDDPVDILKKENITLDLKGLLMNRLDLEAYGKLLASQVLVGAILDLAVQTMETAKQRPDPHLAIQIEVDESAEILAEINWERIVLPGPNLFLARYDSASFSRRVMGAKLTLLKPVVFSQQPIHMAVILASPADLGTKEFPLCPLDVELEIRNIWDAVRPFVETEDLELTVAPGHKTLSQELADELAAGHVRVATGPTTLLKTKALLSEHQIVHLIAHGTIGINQSPDIANPPSLALYLENETGHVSITKQPELVENLKETNSLPHLIFLSACQSGHSSIGLGPDLVKLGTSAVIAMQDMTPVALAQQVTAAFYSTLIQKGSVSQALNQARNKLDRNQSDWSIPVLFTNQNEEYLFSPNPVRLAIKTLLTLPDFAFFEDKYIDLPIEVLPLTRSQMANVSKSSMENFSVAQDLLEAMENAFRSNVSSPQGQLILLSGSHGNNKSTQLRRVVWHTAKQSLAKSENGPILPVYVKLSQLNVTTSLKSQIFTAFKGFWPKEDELEFDRRLQGRGIMRIVLDGSECLTGRERQELGKELLGLITQYPQNQYILAVEPAHIDDIFSDHPAVDFVQLEICALSQNKIRHFLTAKPDQEPIWRNLLREFIRQQIFDVVSLPGLFVSVILRSHQNSAWSISRSHILQGFLDENAQKIDSRSRSAATEVLYWMGWKTQLGRQPSLAENQILEENPGLSVPLVRRREILDDLLRETLLVQRSDQIMFPYKIVQSYCCAVYIAKLDAEEKKLAIQEMVLEIGRLQNLRWWKDTLIFLADLLTDTDVCLADYLLDLLIFQTDLHRSEQVSLAAHCLIQRCNQKDRPAVERSALSHIIGALTWCISSQNDPNITNRMTAATLLSQLAEDDQIEVLLGTLYSRIRKDIRGKLDYDYGSVRLAALIGLQKVQQLQTLRPILARIDGLAEDDPLVDILDLWSSQNASGLARFLHHSDPGPQSIAALVLGDLHAQLRYQNKHRSRRVLQLLTAVFFAPDMAEATTWATAHALSLCHMTDVLESVIQPFPCQLNPEGDQGYVLLRYKCLAYLVSQFRLNDPATRTFLLRDCLLLTPNLAQGFYPHEFEETRLFDEAPLLVNEADSRLWLTVLRGMGRIADSRDERILSAIAQGKFTDVYPDHGFSGQEQETLRRGALEALADIGSMQTVNDLQPCFRIFQDGISDNLWADYYQMCQTIFERHQDLKRRPITPS